jgi:hypothetical protein
MARAVALALAGLVACTPDPHRVFVQGTPFRHVVRITTERGDSPSVLVGEPLVLHASRESGPWVEKPRSAAPEDGCWVEVVRPQEAEVAANLDWHVTPAGAATFNVPTLADVGDLTRTVRFSKPGEYRLSATSALPCSRQDTNVLTVSVREK